MQEISCFEGAGWSGWSEPRNHPPLVGYLDQMLSNLTALQALDLKGNKIGAAGATGLASGLRHLTALRQLDLDGNDIKDAGVRSLAPSLLFLTALR